MKRLSNLMLCAAIALGQPLLAGPLPAAPAASPQAPLSTPALVEQMRKGGYILLVRHERTEVPSRGDDFSKPRHDCFSQRNLSASGHAGARETGETLRILGIGVAEVRSSPICRTMETARLMFGEAIPDERLMHDDPPSGRTVEIADRDVRNLASSIDLSRGNVALVTHGGIIRKAFDITVVEGAIAVVARDGKGNFVLVGQTTGSDLDFPARAASRKE
jgi:broad specificity phosphatase PhoE